MSEPVLLGDSICRFAGEMRMKRVGVPGSRFNSPTRLGLGRDATRKRYARDGWLLGSEQPISGVAETGQDVSLRVELTIE